MITVIEGPETQFGTQTLQGVFTVKDLKDLIESFYGKTVKRFNKVVRDTFSNLDTRSTLIREAKNNPSNPIFSILNYADTTTNLLQLPKFKDLNVTRLAQGIPMGGEVHYLDENTLNTAFQSRKKIT